MSKIKIIFVFIVCLIQIQSLNAESYLEMKLPYPNSKIKEITSFQNNIVIVGELYENYYDVFIAVIDTSTGKMKSRIFSTPSREINPKLQILNNKIIVTFWELINGNYDNQIQYVLNFDLQILDNKQLTVNADDEVWGNRNNNETDAYVGTHGVGNADLLLYSSSNITGKPISKLIGNNLFNWGYDCEFDKNKNLLVFGHTYLDDYNFYFLKLDSSFSNVIYSKIAKSQFRDFGRRTHFVNNQNIFIGNSLRGKNEYLQLFNLDDKANVKYSLIFKSNDSKTTNYDLIINGSCVDDKFLYIVGVYYDKIKSLKNGLIVKIDPIDGKVIWSKLSKINNCEFKSIVQMDNKLLVGGVEKIVNLDFGTTFVFTMNKNSQSCLLDTFNIEVSNEPINLVQNDIYFKSLIYNYQNSNINNSISNLDVEKNFCNILTKNPCLTFELNKKDFNSGCGTDSVKLSIVPNLPNYTFNWNTSETSNSITARKTGKYKVYIQSIENIDCLDSIEIDIEINNNSNNGGKLNKLIIENESYPFSLDTVYSNTIDCRKIKIKNISNIDVSLTEESFIINKQYSIPRSQFPLNIKSKDSISLLYCFNSNISGIYRDTLIINDECNPHKLKFVSYSVVPDKVGSNKCNSEFDISFNKKLIEKNIKFSNFFPNPVSDNLSINFEIDNSSSTESLDFEYTIYNVIGIELVKDNISYNSIDNNLQTITISFLDLSKGNYFVKVKHFSSIKSFWVIKE